MNGFGQDPNYIYSMSPYEASRGGLDPNARFGELRSSRGYQFADPQARQRMEKMVGMGLPPNIDPKYVERVGGGTIPTYRASRPLPWGTFGGFGMTEEQRRQREAARTTPAGGPQPAQGTANIAQGIAPTLGETPPTYSGSAFGGTAYTPSAGNMGMGAYRPPTTTPQATSIAGGIGPAPLAAPLPSLSFPTKEDEILNPYGLSNY